METYINQIITALIISAIFIFFIHCASIKKIPSITEVLKICSQCLLVIVSFVLITLSFYPPLIDWMKQSPIPLTIAGLLILTSVIQSIWSPKVKE